jgi:tRNA A-37 threonylcarbamoyl transferase component Bud32
MNLEAMRGTWKALHPRFLPPPLEPDLSLWDVEKARPSHLNCRRVQGGQTYFLKWFFHGPWRNPARKEWDNARRLDELGIPTVLPVGWGRHPRGTFIAFEASPGTPASRWRSLGLSSPQLRGLTAELARLVARLHDSRLCHKDLNVYHVLVQGESLRLIDVGRVTRFLRRRWIVKDLASLLHSAWKEGIPPSWARLFLRVYLTESRRKWPRRRLLRAVQAKARRYWKHNLEVTSSPPDGLPEYR